MNFDQVYAAELERIHAERRETERSDALVGLAFSGGGIRSATFNLGILQGLAQRGLLKHIDYLSTVSGGGYIGAWYMALLKRQANGRPEQAEALLDPAGHGGAHAAEADAVLWLRRFSNYLTPKTGLSGDTLAMIATYLRNLLLNLAVIVAFLCCLLLLPRALAWSVPFLQYYGALPWLAFVPLALAVIALLARLFPPPHGTVPGRRSSDPTANYAGPERWRGQGAVLVTVVAPTLVGAFSLALLLASSRYAAWSEQLSAELAVRLPGLGGAGLDDRLLAMLFVAAAVYLLPWVLGGCYLIGRQALSPRTAEHTALPVNPAALVFSALAASALAGLLFYALAELAQGSAATPFEQVVIGLPLTLLACIVPVGLHIGLARRNFTELQREWWSRLGGWLLALAGAWLLVSAIALFGAIAIERLNQWIVASGGVGWLIATLWGIFTGKSAATGQPGRGGWREMALRHAPWIFLLGLLCLLSLALQKTLAEPPAPAVAAKNAPASWSGQITMTLESPQLPSYTLSGQASGAAAAKDAPDWRRTAAVEQASVPARSVLYALGILLALFLLLGWRVDINLFSLHNFYRTRLTRAYLGASRQGRGTAKSDGRHPDPFTGFDEGDDVAVTELPRRPYPLFNTALNLVGGDELAWQQRMAASFCIAPEYCGYQFPAGLSATAQARAGYGPTRRFLCGAMTNGGGVRLSTAMAISGAAVNPNMGFHSSPAVSFLLTVFNVRLGRWVGNPQCAGAWSRLSPRFGALHLFCELFGLTSIHHAWLNLSDGGHFENLGIYELVRRRLPYIVAVDAAQDADYLFDDLANAIRKIRTDFCVDIEIDVSALRPRPGEACQPSCVAIGRIRYDRVDAQREAGVLVYIRPGLTGAEPADVLSYARQNPPFPYQSTADQFFDEAQFESYRKLGAHIAATVLREAPLYPASRPGAFNPEAFFTALRESWRAPLLIDPALASAHHERLDALYERLRSDPTLIFLSAEFYPEWPALTGKPAAAQALPADEAQRRSGFYLCREIAQLMEQVYLDLDLERHYDHPDCRGWINLFRHWSWSPMFRATYAISAGTRGDRFQRFCARRLQLELGRVELISAGINEASLATLNFVERRLVSEQLAQTRQADVPTYELIRFDLVIGNPGDNARELLRFHFGFALLAGRQLLSFRIQDHLRRMGLARQAMLRLLASHPGLEVSAATPVKGSGHAVVRGLAESVRAILHAERRGD